MLHFSTQSEADLYLDLQIENFIENRIGIWEMGMEMGLLKAMTRGWWRTPCAYAEIFASAAQLTHWLHASGDMDFGHSLIMNFVLVYCKKHDGEATVCHGQISCFLHAKRHLSRTASRQQQGSVLSPSKIKLPPPPDSLTQKSNPKSFASSKNRVLQKRQRGRACFRAGRRSSVACLACCVGSPGPRLEDP
jgi:hypothetical protein